MKNLKSILLTAVHAAYLAGIEILKVYDSDFDVETKADNSPLTLADQNANRIIEEILSKSNLPILSEEGRDISFEERDNWDYFWMVDPLDGTKEFVKRNGEFTVNIALIKDKTSIAGVIYVPVKRTLYFNADAKSSYVIKDFKWENGLTMEVIENKAQLLPLQDLDRPYTVVGSRSHMSEETEAYIHELKGKQGEIAITSMGSSLKICLVAEGKADVYPRFAPTMEWDTAAGHAIAKGAGKNIFDKETGEEMSYNKRNLLNNWFLVK